MIATLVYPFFLGARSISSLGVEGHQRKAAAFLLSLALTLAVLFGLNPPVNVQALVAAICYFAGFKQAKDAIQGFEQGFSVEWALLMSGVVVGFLIRTLFHIVGV